MKHFLLILAILGSRCQALFEDQAFKFDWKHQYVGQVEDLHHFHSSSKSKDILVVRTSSNVLAALDGDSGQILWRQLSTKDEKLLHLGRLDDNKLVKTLSYNPSENATFIRTWNVNNGALQKEDRFDTVITIQVIDKEEGAIVTIVPEISYGFIHNGLSHLVHYTEQNGLKVYVIHDEDKKNLLSFSTGAGEDKDGFSCTISSDTLVCVSNMLSMIYYTKLPLSGNRMLAAALPSLGVMENLRNGQKIQSLPGGKIQISLESGSVAILSFKDGQFSGINTLQNKKSHHFLHAVQCWNKMEEGLIVLEQNCENDLTCSKLVTLTKNNQQNTYEASSDRGFITKSWAFCDRDEPDAFQLVIESQDGSIVSLTPLGNIMWQREEGLALIKDVQLISKGFDDDIYDHTSDSAAANNPTKENLRENVSEMFVRRMKHHFAQLHNLIEKIKHGYISIGSLLLGNPDSSYDDFGLRKVIVALTHHGSLYGLDSKSGKVLWQKMTSCSSVGVSYLMQQRDSTHHGLEPVLAVVCAASKPSGAGQILKLNPLNGKLIDGSSPRLIRSKITRAILLHHSNHDDHIRPILVLTENQGHELEPKDSGKFLKEISGKMFVANLDADRQGIHGFRIMINEDNSLDMIPVWSFSSSNANIIHLATKSTEEVVHSQGRVMADRSVLFKYLNPNLAFVLAEGKESSNGKSFINVYLLDLVTGRIIFGANHKRVQGPYHVVHSENWAVYTYFNEKSRRGELGSLELFEGKTQNNATVFSSIHNTLSPLVERQAYILAPSYVTALKDTVTEKGITTKNLLMATAAGSIYNIPRGFLDPRRPNMNTPYEMREPGLPPYVPELMFPPEVILNYNQTIAGVTNIVTSPTGLESTSVVLAYGLDVYCTRVTPSKGFDLLKDDFDHFVIASVLVALTTAAYVTRKLSQRKMMKSAWR